MAAETGHNWLGVGELLCAILDSPPSPLAVRRQRLGRNTFTLDDLRESARSIVPGPAR
ncbi:hypothetical protein [Nocardia paucivorans]|uniref:hypothetical protein n=1 Tax=Nocardia paucivorans TaxID=114259 RepID=UPI00031707B5|nr:hypothetical protein [Nocardia paucivorans]